MSDLRELTEQEKNTLDCLASTYEHDLSRLPAKGLEDLQEKAQAIMRVQGLIDRLKRTGMVTPVVSTVERCVS